MSFVIENLAESIAATKQKLREQLPGYREVFQEMEGDIRAQVEEVRSQDSPVPEVAYADIAAGNVEDSKRLDILRRGVAVVRGTFSEEQAREWDDAVAAYVTENDLDAKLAHAAEDKYFGTLKSAKPQIYGVYWSRPQMEARTSPELTATRVWMNKLWKNESEGRVHFDPEFTPVYADRIRRRPPGSSSLGLSPHVDGGSVERWLDSGFQKVYRHVLAGDWRSFDAWDAAYRPDVQEVASPAVCSMFRTFQGWTALTSQGKGDGTLQVVPIANVMAYMVLRALQDDVPDDELCGAEPGRALSANERWHSLLMQAVVSIPKMRPGDTVWWHPDVIHAVENEHKGTGYSNVMYIASTVGCAKNMNYLKRQLPAFLEGKTPPDFAPDDFEVDFKGRATVEDLSPLGRKQMGMQ